MDANKMREQFEAWVLHEYPNQNMGRFSDGEYHSTTIQYCWLAWQASREVVVVELPSFVDLACRGTSKVLSDFRSTIEAQGLKVKP